MLGVNFRSWSQNSFVMSCLYCATNIDKLFFFEAKFTDVGEGSTHLQCYAWNEFELSKDSLYMKTDYLLKESMT